MATLSARAADESVEKLAQDPTCARAIEWIDKNAAWMTDQQIRLTEIPAPEFKEARRGDALRKLFEANGLRVRVDKIGNVIGERPGSSSKDVVLLVAHLDTVFPTGTNVTVKRNASRLEAPGISDNGAGLAALIGVSRALVGGSRPHDEDAGVRGRRGRRRRRKSSRHSRAGGRIRSALIRRDCD